MAIMQTVLMFSTMIIIPFIFVQDGITHVYDGIRLYHPYLLFYENRNGIYFLTAGILIETGRVLISPASWDKAFRIHPKKLFQLFTIRIYMDYYPFGIRFSNYDSYLLVGA